MHDFRYVRGRLFCEGVSVASLVKKHGSPLYVYSSKTLTDHFTKLNDALAPLWRASSTWFPSIYSSCPFNASRVPHEVNHNM